MTILYLSQWGGTQIDNFSYYIITTDKSKACASTNLEGTNHNWPRNNVWLELTHQAFNLWKGEIKEENGIIFGLLK